MKRLTDERIAEIEAAWKKWKARKPSQASMMTRAKFAATLEAAIPELLAERDELRAEVESLQDNAAWEGCRDVPR